MRHARRSLALCAATVLALAVAPAGAQSPRPGIRVRIGQIASGGGLSGSAFLPLPPSAVSAAPLRAGGCAGTRITGHARLPRGPVRAVAIALHLAPASRRVAIASAEPGCEGATLRLELEDGGSIALERGELEVVRGDVASGSLEARFSGTGTRGGDPITVTGEARLALSPSPVR